MLLFIAIFFKELLAISFDEETAVASGLPVKFLYFGLLAAMALTVMVSVKLVGIVLASALLVIPQLRVPLQQKLPDHVLSLATGIGGSASGLSSLISWIFLPERPSFSSWP